MLILFLALCTNHRLEDNSMMRSSSLLALSIALFPSHAFSQGYTNESEVHLYGQSPPVYPSRMCL